MTLRHATAITAALATVLVACTACGHNTDSPAPPPTPSHRPSLDLSHAEGSPVPYDEAVATFKAVTENSYQLHKAGKYDPQSPAPTSLTAYAKGQALDAHLKSLKKVSQDHVTWHSGTYKILSIRQVPTPKDHPKGITLETCEDWRGIKNTLSDGTLDQGILVIHHSTYEYSDDRSVKQVFWDGKMVESCH